MMVKYLREFIFKNYYKWIGFTKEDNLYSMKKQKAKRFGVSINLMKKHQTLLKLELF